MTTWEVLLLVGGALFGGTVMTIVMAAMIAGKDSEMEKASFVEITPGTAQRIVEDIQKYAAMVTKYHNKDLVPVEIYIGTGTLLGHAQYLAYEISLFNKLNEVDNAVQS